MTARTPCKACGAPLLWGITRNGRRIPLDAEPRPVGNVELHADGRAVVHKTAPLSGVPLHSPHHATCPNASQFRRIRYPTKGPTS